MRKNLLIITYGCQMNVYDSQRMADILKPLGYQETTDPADADMIILNTCHIREKATEKVFSDLGRLKAHKDKRAKEGKDTIIAVAGCVAQAEGEEITRRAKYVDMVFGPQTYHELPKMIAELHRARDSTTGPGRGILNVEFHANEKFDALPEVSAPNGPSAFLTIQEGCDKFCHFCCVPYTRGAEYSRPAQDVIAEAKKLVDLGAKDITLLGQNVNAYHGEYGLGQLMYELSKIDGLERIRYTTSHPRDVDDELIQAHTMPKVMPYLHLPVQSGSDKILKAMNRKHTAQHYLEIIDKLRKARPDIAFSSDFIVGYPGETKEDFENTLRLVEEVNYAMCYSFKYSKRPGTPAALADNQVPEEEKDERLQALQELLWQQQTAFNKSKIGSIQPVLFEKPGRKEGQIIGKSPFMQSVHVKGNQRLIGHIIDVEIIGATQNSLEGVIKILDV